MAVARLVAERVGAPSSVVEPTCGRGAMLLAALDRFPQVAEVVGLDINPVYAEDCAARLRARGLSGRSRIECASFFDTDWPGLLDRLPSPLLVIGNPPWVTNSALSRSGGSNLPAKANTRAQRGIEAITGRSNFDISEWMLGRLVDLLGERTATLAMLCKTTVARRVLADAWQNGRGPLRADLYAIDAARHFGAAVDACLLLCELRPEARGRECEVHDELSAAAPATGCFGWRDDALVADVEGYRRRRHLLGAGGPRWRSGIKHDCARVMELRREGASLRNGLGEVVDLEPDYLYPMLKSSDLARGRSPHRFMLVTQRETGQSTDGIARAAPRTWAYLVQHEALLAGRASSIYQGRPRFSVFGVGPYAFAPWKVAISGFYKRLDFAVVGPVDGRPVVFDDTCYFLSCETERDARGLLTKLASAPVRELYEALVFWDSKRPITAQLLGRVDLGRA